MNERMDADQNCNSCRFDELLRPSHLSAMRWIEMKLAPDIQEWLMWKHLGGVGLGSMVVHRYDMAALDSGYMLFGDSEMARKGIARVVAIRGNEEKHKTKRRMVMETFLSIVKIMAEGLCGLFMLCAFGLLAVAAVLGLALERNRSDGR